MSQNLDNVIWLKYDQENNFEESNIEVIEKWRA